jgi:hypothetical protein
VKSLYVEVRIRAPLEELWRHPQEPELHERWDLRFTRIRYLPRPDPAEPQRFLYSTLIGFGRSIDGEGESVATRSSAEGERVSSLRFWSDEHASLIREGSGYWKYVPTSDGIRFLTDYNYRTRFGAIGGVVDALAFRPLLGWATAWSFDRLRRWLERGTDPESSLRLAALYSIARLALAFVWLYQGLVPKILYRHPDELRLLSRSGIAPESAEPMLLLVGLGEIALGLSFFFPRTGRLPFVLSLALLVAATVLVAVTSPADLTAAFNPVSLNMFGIALSAIGLIAAGGSPSARFCLRKATESLR